MLRGEYKPRKDDGVEGRSGVGIGVGVELMRRRASEGGGARRPAAAGHGFEELTISDLQRLEELAGSFFVFFVFRWLFGSGGRETELTSCGL